MCNEEPRKIVCFVLLKDKQRYIKFFKSLLEQALVQIRQHQTESGWGSRQWEFGKGFYTVDVDAKQENYLIGYSSVALLGKTSLAVDNWLFLGFDFSAAGLDSGLGLCLFT